MKSREIFLLLHDIRSVFNVGAIFRTADAVGVSRIYLTGYTPTPLDRFGTPRPDLAKSALGAEKTVPWEYFKTPRALLARMKKEGVQIISLEQDRASVDYKKIKPAKQSLVIVGNEVRGVSKAILKSSDAIVEIPMRGKKESLNVSVSAGIVLYRWFDR